MIQQSKPGAIAHDDLRELLTADLGRVGELLCGDTELAKRYLEAALLAAKRKPALLSCSRESLRGCLLVAAHLRLIPDSRIGLLHWGVESAGELQREAILVPGYAGFLEILLREANVTRVDARAVYQRDVFRVEFGCEPSITHEPEFRDEPGPMICVYCVGFMDGGEQKFEILRRREIDGVQDPRAEKGSARDWTSRDGVEIAKTLVIKRLCKTLGRSDDMRLLIHLERAAELGEARPSIVDIARSFGIELEEAPRELRSFSATIAKLPTEKAPAATKVVNARCCHCGNDDEPIPYAVRMAPSECKGCGESGAKHFVCEPCWREFGDPDSRARAVAALSSKNHAKAHRKPTADEINADARARLATQTCSGSSEPGPGTAATATPADGLQKSSGSVSRRPKGGDLPGAPSTPAPVSPGAEPASAATTPRAATGTVPVAGTPSASSVATAGVKESAGASDGDKTSEAPAECASTISGKHWPSPRGVCLACAGPSATGFLGISDEEMRAGEEAGLEKDLLKAEGCGDDECYFPECMKDGCGGPDDEEGVPVNLQKKHVLRREASLKDIARQESEHALQDAATEDQKPPKRSKKKARDPSSPITRDEILALLGGDESYHHVLAMGALAAIEQPQDPAEPSEPIAVAMTRSRGASAVMTWWGEVGGRFRIAVGGPEREGFLTGTQLEKFLRAALGRASSPSVTT